MKIIPFQPLHLSKKDAHLLRSAFLAGSVIAFPSDTAYGLAINPQNTTAVRRIFELKQRMLTKEISCIFDSIEQVCLYAVLTKQQKEILQKYLPGLFTFIVPPTKKYPLAGTVGVRIPKSMYTEKLSQIFGAPYTATSANISGNASLYSARDVVAEFEKMPLQPDIVLDVGALSFGRISTVVDLTGKSPKIIREGSGRFLL